MYGPQVPYSEELHGQKYRGENESFREAGNRISNALKDDEAHFHAFREIYLNMRFLPGGRIQSAMGASKTVTAYNCFVSGPIEDSLLEGTGSIDARAGESLATLRMGGGIGYDWSTLRPKGAMIKKLQTRSGGPLPWMDYYDFGARAIVSAGHRRGAQMGVLRVDHPDIMSFIHAKQNSTRLTSMNLSVGITDEFMEAMYAEKNFMLRFGGEEYGEIFAPDLWNALMRSTFDWAEPGVLFLDEINRMNNLWYCEKIAATNPCGEQPLPPYGACLLGSFNLVKYLVRNNGDDLIEAMYYFDFDQFKADIPIVVRAMDNVIERTIYPLYEQEKEAKAKRRMGLGVCALANALEVMGLPYGSVKFIEMEERILWVLKNEAYRASARLAREKGAFPLYHQESYMRGKFIQTLEQDVQNEIVMYGIRNSHLTSIAPTGTISTAADIVTGGVEPVFSLEHERTVIEFDGERKEQLQDYAFRVYGVRGKQAENGEVTVEDHVNVQLAAQRHVDSAVSKTCNVPTDIPWEKFKNVYVQAHKGGAKGCTTFRRHEAGRGAVLVATREGAACEIVNGVKSCE